MLQQETPDLLFLQLQQEMFRLRNPTHSISSRCDFQSGAPAASCCTARFSPALFAALMFALKAAAAESDDIFKIWSRRTSGSLEYFSSCTAAQFSAVFNQVRVAPEPACSESQELSSWFYPSGCFGLCSSNEN
ncbi:hypothetical protein XENOCAPTIV_021351 [Xenoophorus captivus]|uniref:Uncharacterized protein n=1 Tax=Xenoophorus captivus TaxID=1517983 RepID=A0ABV0QNV4_9TELE